MKRRISIIIASIVLLIVSKCQNHSLKIDTISTNDIYIPRILTWEIPKETVINNVRNSYD